MRFLSKARRWSLQIATPAPRKDPLFSKAAPEPEEKNREETASSGSEERYPALYGRLRGLRAVAQNLRGFATELDKRAAAIEDAESRKKEVLTSLEEGTPVLAHDRGQIDSRLSEIRKIVEDADQLYSDYGDVIARLEASWEEALTQWPPEGDRQEYVARISRRLPRLVAALDAMIYDCGLITLPNRLTDHLALLPIGASLGFREGYEDELPAPEDQKRFLRYLDLYPGFVEGLVDVEHGCIYRAAPQGPRRRKSLYWTVSIALSGFLLIALACGAGYFLTLKGWRFTPARFQELMTGYLFLLLGAVGHIVVNLLKQDRASTGSARGLSDWLLRIHVKEASFMLSAGSLALAPIAMAFFFDSVEWATAFFVGYSYDSFLDLFLQRFEGVVSSVTKTIKV
jgi:hypothetical protein